MLSVENFFLAPDPETIMLSSTFAQNLKPFKTKYTGKLSDTQTSNIVPVDLNSIIQMNAKIMCSWFEQIGNQSKADKYCKIAQQFLNNIRDVRDL